MYYKLTINEQARNSLKDEATLFNTIIERFDTVENAQKYIIGRYGIIPRGKNKIHVDDNNGNAQEIGFTYSYWNSSYTIGSKSWYQTDWIIIEEITTKPVLL